MTDPAGHAPDPGPVRAELARIRNRAALAYASPAAAGASAADVPRLLAALDAVLGMPGKWDEIDDGPVSALTEDRGWVRAACARDLREAITRELLGEEGASG